MSFVDQVKEAKRSGDYATAERLLLESVDEVERESKRERFGVAPWYYEQLAIVYRKQKRYDDEVAVLERFARQKKAPGAGPAKLKARLEKARERSKK